ncbi:hypothetical protein AKO1_003867 [Acrasis kona]|uniref:Uncharacterized protein n=1 Tax=Acrasis kona TaxID=1008807 RepID=A0AAW2ZJA9_9EUKA
MLKIAPKPTTKCATPKKSAKRGLIPLVLNTKIIGPILNINESDTSNDSILLKSMTVMNFFSIPSCTYDDIPYLSTSTCDPTIEPETVVDSNPDLWKREFSDTKHILTLCELVMNGESSKQTITSEFAKKISCYSKACVDRQLKQVSVRRQGVRGYGYYIKDAVLRDLNITSQSM